jgi:hypothetical protein
MHESEFPALNLCGSVCACPMHCSGWVGVITLWFLCRNPRRGLLIFSTKQINDLALLKVMFQQKALCAESCYEGQDSRSSSDLPASRNEDWTNLMKGGSAK